jgi:hypothetical protein
MVGEGVERIDLARGARIVTTVDPNLRIRVVGRSMPGNASPAQVLDALDLPGFAPAFVRCWDAEIERAIASMRLSDYARLVVAAQTGG